MLKSLFKLLQQLFIGNKKTKPNGDNLLKKWQKTIKIAKPERLRNSSRKLEDVHPKLQTAFRLIREYFRHKNPGYNIILTQTYRSPEDQNKLYQQGRTAKGKIVTYINGIKKKGKHNVYPAKGVDVKAHNFHTGKSIWDMKYYRQLPRITDRVSRELGYKITNGGRWKRLKDYPHFEIQ